MHGIERFTPVVIAANGTVSGDWTQTGIFACVVTGTITIVNGNGTTILAAMPVTAGNVYDLKFYLQGRKGTVTLAGGAAGTLGVA